MYIMQMVAGHIRAQVLETVIELEIADALGDSPKTAAELAEQKGGTPAMPAQFSQVYDIRCLGSV